MALPAKVSLRRPPGKPGPGHEVSFAMGGSPDAWPAAASLKLLAAIELSIDARQRLLPRSTGVEVPCQLHGVVQQPTYNLPVASMHNPARSPLRVLEQLAGRALV